jgi:pyridoxine 5-phosphate synthase
VAEMCLICCVSCQRHSAVCARGITIHPRPGRTPYLRYQDARDLKKLFTPNIILKAILTKNNKFIDLVCETKPTQVTPLLMITLTSNAGWNTTSIKIFLTEIVQEFQRNGIGEFRFCRSITWKRLEGAKSIGTERIELYTEALLTIQF